MHIAFPVVNLEVDVPFGQWTLFTSCPLRKCFPTRINQVILRKAQMLLPQTLDLEMFCPLGNHRHGHGGGAHVLCYRHKVWGCRALGRHNLPAPTLALWPTEVHVVVRRKLCKKGCYFGGTPPPKSQCVE